MNLSMVQRADAATALGLLKKSNVNLSLTEIIRTHCSKLPQSEPILLKDAIHEYMKEQSDIVSDTHYRNLKTYLENERSLGDVYGNEWLHEISKDDIAEWLRIRCHKRSKRTYDAFLIQAKAVFNWCVDNKMLSENPCAGLKKYNETGADPEVFTPTQAHELLQLLKSDEDNLDLYLGFAVQLFAGVRRAEVGRLCWGNLTEDKIRLTKQITKTQKGRAVPICEALKSILGQFEGYRSKKHAKAKIVSLKHDDWDTKRKQVMKKLKWEKWPHNGLRHSYVSYRLTIAGMVTAAYEAGHSVEVLLVHYDGLVDISEANDYFSITSS